MGLCRALCVELLCTSYALALPIHVMMMQHWCQYDIMFSPRIQISQDLDIHRLLNWRRVPNDELMSALLNLPKKNTTDFIHQLCTLLQTFFEMCTSEQVCCVLCVYVHGSAWADA